MTSGRVAHCDLGNLLPTDLQLSSATDASYTLMCLPRSEWEEQCQPGWLQVYPPSRQYVTLGTCAMRTHLSRFLTFGSGRPVQVCHRDCRGWSGTLARGVNSHGWRVSHCSGYEEMSKSPRPDKPSLAFFNLSAPGTDDNWPRAAPAALAFSSGEASGSNDWDVSRRVWISCMGGRVPNRGHSHGQQRLCSRLHPALLFLPLVSSFRRLPRRLQHLRQHLLRRCRLLRLRLSLRPLHLLRPF